MWVPACLLSVKIIRNLKIIGHIGGIWGLPTNLRWAWSLQQSRWALVLVAGVLPTFEGKVYPLALYRQIPPRWRTLSLSQCLSHKLTHRTRQENSSTGHSWWTAVARKLSRHSENPRTRCRTRTHMCTLTSSRSSRGPKILQYNC